MQRSRTRARSKQMEIIIKNLRIESIEVESIEVGRSSEIRQSVEHQFEVDPGEVTMKSEYKNGHKKR